MKNIFLIILIITAIYAYCYFIFPSHISIIQTSLQEFDFNLLLNRQPIVIEDQIKDVLTVISSWFSPNIIEDIQFDSKRTWNLNFHKYLYCYATDDTDILLYPPGNKVINDIPDNREPILAIKLKKNQSLIIPFRWYYNAPKNVKLYAIHDYMTYIIAFIF
jgi:hypothetical protein